MSEGDEKGERQCLVFTINFWSMLLSCIKNLKKVRSSKDTATSLAIQQSGISGGICDENELRCAGRFVDHLVCDSQRNDLGSRH
jgi:hypothetical protein